MRAVQLLRLLTRPGFVCVLAQLTKLLSIANKQDAVLTAQSAAIDGFEVRDGL